VTVLVLRIKGKRGGRWCAGNWVARVYVILLWTWVATALAPLPLKLGLGLNAPTLAACTYLTMTVLFFTFMTWMLFSSAPDARAGARVYLACSVPTHMWYPVVSIGFSLGTLDAGWTVFTALAGHQITLPKSIYMVAQALVFNVPFTIVCLLLFRRMWVLERSQVAYCLGCGQDLSGISSHTCPECGTMYKQEDLQIHSR
jgi:hypothetical protein